MPMDCLMDVQMLSELPFMKIPRDPNDSDFVVSFEYSDPSSKEFFDHFGFVVFRNIYSSEECDRTRSAMWTVVEEKNPGFDHNDPSTWGLYASAGKYGLSLRGPCFDRNIVRNRQHPHLIAALARIIESDDVMVSHDRFTIYRATGSDIPDGELFRTGPRNVHLDLNPWWWCESSPAILDGLDTLRYAKEQDFIRENNMVVKSMGLHVQCVMNFMDNVEDDGGTVLVPGFHRHVEEWCSRDPSLEGVSRQPLPWLHFPDSSPLLRMAQRVPMRAGSVLVWHQTMVHGTSPNNCSNRCRMAQFMKAFPGRTSISPQRLQRRAEALTKALVARGIDIDKDITPIGRRVFGLDYAAAITSPSVSREDITNTSSSY